MCIMHKKVPVVNEDHHFLKSLMQDIEELFPYRSQFPLAS
jgi:hypothetical protein